MERPGAPVPPSAPASRCYLSHGATVRRASESRTHETALNAPDPGRSGLLQELKRRKTVRTAIVYLAGAYAVLQVGEVILPGLGAPEWVFRVLVILAGLGLPIAVILAWAFRLTPTGLERERDVGDETPESGREGQGPDVEPGGIPSARVGPPSGAGGEVPWLTARTVIAVLALVALSLATGWWLGGSGVASSGADEGSIAVLPFQDFSSGADQEWFAAGMQEALITALQKIGALRVTSRTSTHAYADTDLPLPDVARQLGTRWLVEGSVARDRERIRITAQLIDGESDRHVWADEYDDEVEDLLALQGTVARAIAEEIDVALSPAEELRLESAPRIDPAAYRAYVLGLDRLYRITPEDFRRSVPLFEDAIARDPTFAPAHAALAVGYATAFEYDWISAEEIGDAGERAAADAVRLDPEATESYHARASVEYHLRRDFPAAERDFREAAARNPSAYALQDYAWMLANLGRHEEAIPIIERATRIDPRSPLMRNDLGWWRFGAGDYDGSVAEGLRALEIDPTYSEAYWLLSTVYAHQGRADDALAAFDRYEEMYGERLPYYRGYLLAVLGRRDEALALAREVETRIARGESTWSEPGLIYVTLGERERALEAVERMDRARISFMPYHMPEWEALYGEPRFRAVVERLGFPPPP